MSRRSSPVDKFAFGKNVRRIRRSHKMTQAALATSLGLRHGQVQVSNWETHRFGLPTGVTMLRLATALECAIGDLLVGVDPAYDAMMTSVEVDD